MTPKWTQKATRASDVSEDPTPASRREDRNAVMLAEASRAVALEQITSKHTERQKVERKLILKAKSENVGTRLCLIKINQDFRHLFPRVWAGLASIPTWHVFSAVQWLAVPNLSADQ